MLSNTLDSLPAAQRPALARVLQSVQRGPRQAATDIVQAAQAQGRQSGIRAGMLSDDETEFMQRRAELLDVVRGNGMRLSDATENLLTQMGTAAGPSLWMFPMALSGVGNVAIAESMAGQSIRGMRRDAPEMDEGLVTNLGTASGMVQGAIERFSNLTGMKIMAGKLPSFTKFLNSRAVGAPGKRALYGFAAGGAATTGMEYAEEVGQGAVDLMFSSLAQDLSGLNPDVDWQGYFAGWVGAVRGEDGEWKAELGEEQRQTLLAVAGFGMVAGAGASFHHFKHGSAIQRSKAFLRANGFNTEQIRELVNEPDPQVAGKKAAAFFTENQAEEAANPEIQARNAEARKEYLEILKASNEALKDSGTPFIVKEVNGFTEEEEFVFITPQTGGLVRKAYATEEEALGAWADWRAEQVEEDMAAVQEAGHEKWLEHLLQEGAITENVNAEVSNKSVTPGTEMADAQAAVKSAETDVRKAITPAQERQARETVEAAKTRLERITARVEVFLLDQGIDPKNAAAVGAALDKVTIKAKSFANYLKGQIVGYTVQLFNGHQVQDITEDFAETAFKIGMDEGFVDPEIILDNIRMYEKASGNRVIAPGYKYDATNPLPLIEGFSKLARGVMMGEVRSGLLPPEVASWIEMQTAMQATSIDIAKAAGAGMQLAMDVRTAGEIRAAVAAGHMPPRLERLLKDSIGLDPDAINRRLLKKHEEQLAAEAMEGFPEVQETLKGRLPHPQTLRENNHPLYGEVRRIWESLKKPTRRRTKDGKTVDRVNEANAFFLPIGTMEDLDYVRQYANERGFDFETITDMLDALDVSISYGKPFYGTASMGNESWAMSEGFDGEAFQREVAVIEKTVVIGPNGKPLAPNGKESNLTLRQWATVRTKAFRNWFGDWMALRVQEQMAAMNPVIVTVPDQWRGKSPDDMRALMAEKLDAMVKSKAVMSHPLLGKVKIGRRGANKTQSTSGDPAKMLISADVESLFPQSILGGFSASNEQGVDGYSKLLIPLSIDGVELVAIFSVRHQADGQWYYNTVVVAAKEERPGSYASPGALSRSLGQTPITGLQDFIRQPLSTVNPESVSRVVDENGEPRVVYHGTNSDFESFDPARAGETFGYDKEGIFFAGYESDALDYAKHAASNKGGEPIVIRGFLNIRNPYTYADHADEYGDAETAEKGMDGRLLIDWADMYRRDHLRSAKEMGKDGIIIERGNEGLFTAFAPTQIKSVDNRGSFSATDERHSYAMSMGGVLRLEEAIAKRMTRGPDERAEYFQRLRDRIASTVLMLRESKRNLATEQSDTERERNRIRDAMAEAQAIIKALPMEARGRVSFNANDILDADTERGQINALIRLIDKADEALEVVLLKEYREAFETLLDLAKPDLRQNKQLRGRLTPQTQRKVGQILAVVNLTPAELAVAMPAKQAEIAALEASNPESAEEIAAAQAKLIELIEEQVVLETFGAFATLDAAQTAHAYEQLQSIYITGRTTRRMLDEARKEEINAAKREVLDSLPYVDQAKHASRTADKGILDQAEAWRLGMSSFHQVMEWLFPRSVTARDFQDKVRKADRAFVRAKLAAKERFDAFTFEVWGLAGRSRTRKRNRILADLSTLRDDWNIELKEGVAFTTEKLTEEQAAAILDGTMKTGWETDNIAMTSLRQALADFRMQRLKAQNEKKRFTSKVIKFQRLTNRGKPGPFVASDLQALYFLQLYAQEQYRPALDKHGFTAEVMEAMERKINPKAKDLGDFLRSEYDAEWARLNPVYRAIYGLDMPKIRNYAPGMFEHLDAKGGADSTIDPYGAQPGVNAMSAGFTKVRTHHMARPKLTNAMAGYWSHLEATEYFIAYAEIMRDARQIFRNPEVRRRLEGNYGSKAAGLFSQWLDALEMDGNFRAVEMAQLAEHTHKVLVTQSAVGLAYNIGVLFKQFSASFGSMLEMPASEAIKGFARAIKNPDSLKHIWNSEAVQQRVLMGISPEDRRLLDAGKASPSMAIELLNAGRLPIAYADAAFTTLGASIAYNYHHGEALKAGLSPAQAEAAALAAASRVIERTAQPATAQDKSMAELTSKGFGKFLFLFKSDPRQKLAIVANAAADAARGKDGAKQALARKLLWGWLLYGLSAELMTDIWQSISRDDDDEDRWSWQDYVASMIAGPVSGIPLLGGVMEYGIRKTVGTKAFVNSANPLDQGASRIVPATKKAVDQFQSGEASPTDVMTTIQQATSAMALVAGAFDQRAAIVPAGARLLRDTTGMVTNFASMFMEPSADDAALEIIRPLAEAQKTTRDGKAEANEALAKELSKLPPDARNARLAKLDADTRATITRKLRAASMTASEAALSRLNAENRKAAIEKITATMGDTEKREYLERLKSLGLR